LGERPRRLDRRPLPRALPRLQLPARGRDPGPDRLRRSNAAQPRQPRRAGGAGRGPGAAGGDPRRAGPLLRRQRQRLGARLRGALDPRRRPGGGAPWGPGGAARAPCRPRRRTARRGQRLTPAPTVTRATRMRPLARFSLLPRDRTFFDLFIEAGQNSVHAAALLDRMMHKGPEEAGISREILKAEQEGDRITHDIIKRLNTTFVTPIDREDIYGLATQMDDIVDYTEEAADFLGLYKIEAPMEQATAL